MRLIQSKLKRQSDMHQSECTAAGGFLRYHDRGPKVVF